MLMPRYVPVESGASILLMRGSTAPAYCVPSISPTMNVVWRYVFQLLRSGLEKLWSFAATGSVAGYKNSASSALLVNDLSAAAITAFASYVVLLVKWFNAIALSPQA